MMASRGMIAIVVGLPMLLAGCLDITKDIAFRSNGEARVEVEIALTPQLAALMQSPMFDQKSNGKEVPNLLRDCGKPWPADPPLPAGVRSAESRRGKRGDMETCTMIFDVADPVKAVEEAQKMDVPSGENMPKQDFSLVRLDSAPGYRLHAGFAMPERPPMPPETAKMIEAMMSAMLTGRQISVSISAQRIENTNGELSPDKRRVTWRLPLESLVNTPPDKPVSFDADIVYR